MSENDVTIVITSKDDSAAGFASSTARTKAYQGLLDQTSRREIAAHGAVRQAESAHERATRLLADAEKILSVNADSTSSSQSRLGRVMSGIGGVFASAMSSLEGFGGSLGSLGVSGPAGIAVMGGLAAAVAAVGAAMGPLIAGLSLITVGIGAFAAAAVPDITKVMTARQKLTAAEKAYDNATTKAQRVAALKAEKMATEGLTGAQKSLMGPMGQIADQFRKLQHAIEPQVANAFGSALDIIRKVMPALTPLAVAAGKALDKFLSNIDHWLSSGSGKKFIHWVETEGPKALATFGQALIRVIHVVGEVMYWWDRLGNDLIRFVKRDAPPVIHAIEDIAKIWLAPVVAMWKVIQAVDHVINAFGRAIGIRHLVRDIAGAIAAAMAAAAHAVYDVVTAVDALLGRIGLASAASGRLAGAGAAAAAAAAGAPVGGGGRPHHASGGITSGGWTQINERGPEIVRLPAGSMVYSAPDTQRMLGQGGGGPVVVHNHIHLGRGRGHSTLDQALLTWLRDNVQVFGGGSVQVAFGTDY